MDVISRLPGCSGQAADAVSAQTQVKWKMLQNFIFFKKTTCPPMMLLNMLAIRICRPGGFPEEYVH